MLVNINEMVAISAFLPTASYATTGSVAITSPTYIIPVSAINAVISGSGPIGTGEAAERLLYGLLQVLYTKNQAGTLGQSQIGCEISTKNITRSVYESTLNSFAVVSKVNYVFSASLGANAVAEDPSNLAVV